MLRLASLPGRPPGSGRFHRWLADAVVGVCLSLTDGHGLDDVCLAGGVFANDLLLDDVATELTARGRRVHHARAVPPGDGGLALGQVLVAHARGGA